MFCLSINAVATFVVIQKGHVRSCDKRIDRQILYSESPNGNAHAHHGNDSSSTSKKQSTRRNPDAQEVFDLISNHCGGPEGLKTQEWKKAKRYIYHATSLNGTKNPIKAVQIKSVLNFLDETFDGNDLDYINSEVVIDTSFIIQSVPRIMKKDVESYLKPTVDFLKGLYGAMFYEFVKRRPDVLLTSGVGFNSKSMGESKNTDRDYFPRQSKETHVENQQHMPVDDYLASQELGLSATQVAKLKKKHPAVFRRSFSKVQETIEYLLATFASPERSVGKFTIGKMIKANPNILNLSVSNINPKVSFLNECGFDTSQEIKMLCKKYPGILCLSLDDNLRPTVTILQDLMSTAVDVSNSKSALYKSLSIHPQLLALSPHNIASKAAYFDTIGKTVNINDDKETSHDLSKKASLAARMAMSAPSVYSLSLDNIRQKVRYLSYLWSVQDDNKSSHGTKRNLNIVAKRIFEYPNILTLSLEGNIQPTISFYNRTGYINLRNHDSTEDDILDDGTNDEKGPTYLPARYLATSLYNRLLPRWNYHVVEETERMNQEKGKYDSKNDFTQLATNYDEKLISAPTRPPLHILAGATDETFCKRMSYDYKTYMKFKEAAIPRLKFSSQFDTWLKTGRPIDV